MLLTQSAAAWWKAELSSPLPTNWGKHSRLFALTAEEDGQVEFSELRSGEPVCITRIRVDFSASLQTRPISPFCFLRRYVPAAMSSRSLFRFHSGLLPTSLPELLSMQRAIAYWLRLDSRCCMCGRSQMGRLRRCSCRLLIAGRLATGTHFLGVRDGFIVAGTMDANLFAVHYDFRTRIVKCIGSENPMEKMRPGTAFPTARGSAFDRTLCVGAWISNRGRKICGTRKYAIIPVLAPIKPMCGRSIGPSPEPWVEVIRPISQPRRYRSILPFTTTQTEAGFLRETI